MVSANVKIIEELQQFVRIVSEAPDIRQLFTNSPSDFTRERKMPLHKLAALLVNLPKRSLSIELQEFLNTIGEGDASYTKGAFCLQRVKLKPVFFSVWNKYLTDSFYHYYEKAVKRWKGYLLTAVDGSTLYLFNKADVKEHFGTQDNQYVQVPTARIMQIEDVLNNLTLWGGIFPIAQSEQQIISSHIHHLPVDSVTIYDRLYPSYAFMYLLINQETPRHFVIRCKSSFSHQVKDFVKSRKHSKTVTLYPNYEARRQLYKHGFKVTEQTAIKVRMVKIRLPTGEMEVLLTNLYDEQKYSLEELKELYAMRWRIETAYGKQKNQQQMEIFTGHKVICIEQDYTASLFTANLQSLIEKQTEQYTNDISIKRRYRYKVNKNLCWAALKNTIVKLFLDNNHLIILQQLENAFIRNLEPIRPGRHVPRNRKAKKIYGKYQTFTNYRRAI